MTKKKPQKKAGYTKAKLLKVLAECAADHDTECAHIDADDALLEFINDPEITEAYRKVAKWYA